MKYEKAKVEKISLEEEDVITSSECDSGPHGHQMGNGCTGTGCKAGVRPTKNNKSDGEDWSSSYSYFSTIFGISFVEENTMGDEFEEDIF